MRSLKTFAIAVTAMAMLAPQAVRAADLPPLLPPPPIEDFGGWYLRGDVGMTNQKVRRLESDLPNFDQLNFVDKNFQSGMLYGLGIGYKYNSWLRFDLTGEYRGEAGFHGLDLWVDGAGDPRFNDYTAKKSEWLILFNAFLDLGTWKGITPFIGAGIGASRNTIHSFRDRGIAYATPGDLDTGYPTLAYANAASKWNLAWALHAGLAYDVTPNFTVELAYRYVDLGDAKTGILTPYDMACTECLPVKFKHLTSHDIKLGVRWMMADMGISHWAPPVSSRY